MLKNLSLVQKQISENVFRHQRAEDAARIGQDVIAAQSGIKQRLDPSPHGLNPLQVWKKRQHIVDEIRCAKNNFTVHAGRSDNVKFWQMCGFEQAQIFICFFRQE